MTMASTWQLAGCGLSWFLFDFVIYGTNFNQAISLQVSL